MVLTVTREATEVMQRLLQGTEHEPGQALRMVVNPEGRMGLTIDREEDADQAFELDGETVLLVALPLSEELTDRILDATEDGDLALRSHPSGDGNGRHPSGPA